MSARKLPRELGVVITCDADGCGCKLQTAVCLVRKNRAYAKSIGWSKLVRPARDLCPEHAAAEKAASAARKKERATKRAERDAARKAKATAPQAEAVT